MASKQLKIAQPCRPRNLLPKDVGTKKICSYSTNMRDKGESRTKGKTEANTVMGKYVNVGRFPTPYMRMLQKFPFILEAARMPVKRQIAYSTQLPPSRFQCQETKR